MISLSDSSAYSGAYIGCSIPAKRGWFVQLVGPGALFERKVLSSAFGGDPDDALLKAMNAAGVTECAGPAQLKPTLMQKITATLGPPEDIGLLWQIRLCELEITFLVEALDALASRYQEPGI